MWFLRLIVIKEQKDKKRKTNLEQTVDENKQEYM